MMENKAAAIKLSLGVSVKRNAGSTGWPIGCSAAAGAVAAAVSACASATTGAGAVVQAAQDGPSAARLLLVQSQQQRVPVHLQQEVLVQRCQQMLVLAPPA
jgi:hypothetical protein